MKQTAVEWLVQEINKINVSSEARKFINKLEKQAKEMETQQQGYIEKEVKNILMKTVLRIVSREEGSEFIDVPNPYNMTLRKDDHFVWKEESYMVSWVEFDFDTNTLYIVSVKD